MMMPFCTATPNSAMKPTADRDVEGLAREIGARSARRASRAARRRGSAAPGASFAELGEQQQRHQPQHEAEDHHQPRLGALLVLELPALFEVILGRVELHRLRDLRLRFRQVGRRCRGRELSIRIVRLRWPFSRVMVLSPVCTRMSATCDSGTCVPLAVCTGRLRERLGRIAARGEEAHGEVIDALADVDR